MAHCENVPQIPFIVRLAGEVPARILQTPAFPQGEADGAPLVALSRWAGCIDGTPGSKVYVSGHVRAAMVSLGVIDGPVPTSAIADDMSAALPVKISIERCGFAGPVMIDSDRGLVVDGGAEIEIKILAPTGWFLNNGRFVIDAAEPPALMFVDLRVSGCPLSCCMPPPAYLTWMSLPMLDADVIVRPRRASTFTPHGSLAGTRWGLWVDDPVLGLDPMQLGEIGFNGSFGNTPAPIGAASHLQLVAGGGAPEGIGMVWEIR